MLPQEQLNQFKLLTLEELKSINSFTSSWNIWKEEIVDIFTENNSILEIGKNLHKVFFSTRTRGRSQSTLSGAGNAFEALVAWYLNMVFWNTNVVVVKKKQNIVPQCIKNALSITISNRTTNSESDLILYKVPLDDLTLNYSQINDINTSIVNSLRGNENKTNLGIIQCKTNWNDNSQIPMLWDLVYNSSVNLPNVSVGRNGFNTSSFTKFSYSFMTVPTNPIQQYSPNSVKVDRVANLTGGNYWSYPSQNGIAKNINEYFLRNFSEVFEGTSLDAHVYSYVIITEIYQKFFELEFL